MKKVLSAVVLLGAVAAGQAAADGMYVQGGFGEAEFGLSGLNDGTAVKVIVGRQYSDNFGVEGQFTDFGEGKYSSGRNRAKVSSKALGVNAVGSLPLDRWVVSGKIGLHRASSKVSETSPTLSLSKSTSKLTPMIGLSVSYAFTRQLEGVVEVDRFNNLLGSDYKKVSGQTGSIGIRYWF